MFYGWQENLVEPAISSEASVKVLFLDIDGVVNNKRTKENFKSFTAIGPAMAALVSAAYGIPAARSSYRRLGGYSRMAGTR
jgi:hypothetical protein